MTPPEKYTTQLQAGLGLIQETRLLLALWQPGMNSNALYREALQSGQFPNVSARRLRNVAIECFGPRYLVSDGLPAKYLKRLAEVLSTSELSQLFFLYTSRANRILADFVREVYWERYAAGASEVTTDDAKAFIHRAMDDGKTAKRWSDTTVKRVASYLVGCCADYGLLGNRIAGGRRIATFRIAGKTSAYLAHDLHFSGLGDNVVVSSPDWQLFGLGQGDVGEEFKRLSLQGHLIHQSAGEVTHIGWKYPTMEEFVDVLAQG